MVANLIMGGASLALAAAGQVAEAAGGAAAPTAGAAPDRLKRTANDFEQVFLEHVMDRMTEGAGEDGPLGQNGAGGSVYRSMLAKEYAGSIVRAGGVGLSDAVYRQMLQLQAGSAHAGA